MPCPTIKFGPAVPDNRSSCFSIAMKGGINAPRCMLLSNHWTDLLTGKPENRSRTYPGYAVLAEGSPEFVMAAVRLIKSSPDFIKSNHEED